MIMHNNLYDDGEDMKLFRVRAFSFLRRLKDEEEDTPMLRPKTFAIEFDAPGAVYFSAQTITGNVVLNVEEPISLKGVKMRFRGECCIHFTDLPNSAKMDLLRKREASLNRRSKRDSFSRIASPVRNYSYINGGLHGVDNPGFIPDSDLGNGDLLSQTSSTNGHIIHRPNSSEHEWREATFGGPIQHFRAQETYFDCEFYIYGHKYQKDEKESLPAGLHKFPFAFNLPPNLPPSFSSEKGFVVYMAVAILDRPAAANLVQKAGFSVHSVLDLNMDSHANSTTSSSKTKNLCCFCCQTGPITLAVQIPRRGYVPGEKIFVNAEADNISTRNTRRTRLLLLQVVTYIMPNGVKTMVEERILKEVVRGIIPPGESDMWENVSLTVPPLVPANVHLTCRLLHVEYRLDMILELPLPSGELRVSLPVTIGSVPLRNRFDSFLPPNETRKPSALPGIKYPNCPSFAFGECMFGPEAIEHQYEKMTGYVEDYGPQYEPLTYFAPNYLCYTPGNNVIDYKHLKSRTRSRPKNGR
ncbi:thioredoxin-interacting protein-like isoform X1 [Macrobrachium rosenbergii]|uniref:thioredoxin-interacting protein-like isoform X1 n=1 Tax=Macrobrachium rosenbergii TaxID=79674 RepID=UPI0034D6F97C